MFGKRQRERQRPGRRIARRIGERGERGAEACVRLRPPPVQTERRSETYFQTKSLIFGALIEAIDLAALSKLDPESAREEIRDIVHEIVTIKNLVLSIAEQEDLLDDICNDVLGFGPLEPLLARDDIADIMVNGPTRCFIEVGGKIQLTNVRFRDASQLMNICQRIVSQVGRRVDESSPICDARLLDGSRVNVIAPPLAIDGAALTIRKFRKDKLTLDQLVKFGSISPAGAEILKIIGRVRCNVVISGGTGSGKTTLLNCLTNYIDADERIITCEDAAELQLQQPHVVRLETRPANLEGVGQITMRDLVKNCLRMRPERIVVGEVRGPEAFDLLQAMNTGHDGSMGTLHANSPREALSRIESMITMGGYALPMKTIREMVTSSVDVIVQASRLRDGSRRITHITEVLGMEGDVVITQDLFVYEILGEDAQGKLIGRHRSTGIGRPKFWDARAHVWRRSPSGGGARHLGSQRSLEFEGVGGRHDQSDSGRGMSGAWIRRSGVCLRWRGLREPTSVARRSRKPTRRRSAAAGVDRAARKKQIADGVRDSEMKGKRRRVSLATKIEQAGLSITKQQYWIGSVLLGLICGALTYVQSRSLLLTLLVAVTATVGLPQLTLARLRIRRINKFISNFPTAIDIIVRGIKSGLPLGDTIRIAATESPEPVKSEFRRIVEALSIGMTLPEGDRADGAAGSDRRNKFLFDRHRHPEQGGRQPLRGLGQSFARVARAQKDEGKDHRHVDGSESFGGDYRRGAVSRRRRALRFVS